MLKKIISVLLLAILFCNTGLVANAQGNTAESEIQPCYEYANTVNATLSKSSGKAVCTGRVTGYSTTTKIKITMTLQKKTLLWWSKAEEWTTTVNNYKATLSKTVAADSGKHRVKVKAVVYSGSDSETITVYSSTVEF